MYGSFFIIYFIISGNKSNPNADSYNVDNEIGIGDWCTFPVSEVIENDDESDFNTVLLGLVLGFTYSNGNTFKQREFSKSFALQRTRSSNLVGVLCDFYTFNEAGILKIVPGDKHKFIKIDSYVGTIKPPLKVKKTLTISSNLVDELNKIDL